MSDNNFAGYFGPHGVFDNLELSRAWVSGEMADPESMNRGAIVGLVVVGVSSPPELSVCK
jgi:hypothetical protein